MFLLCRNGTLAHDRGWTCPFGGSPLVGRMLSPRGTVRAGTKCRRAAARHIGNGNVEIHATGTSLCNVRYLTIAIGNFYVFLLALFGAKNPCRLRINRGTALMYGHGNAVPSLGCLLCHVGGICTAHLSSRPRSVRPRWSVCTAGLRGGSYSHGRLNCTYAGSSAFRFRDLILFTSRLAVIGETPALRRTRPRCRRRTGTVPHGTCCGILCRIALSRTARNTRL